MSDDLMELNDTELIYTYFETDSDGISYKSDVIKKPFLF